MHAVANDATAYGQEGAVMASVPSSARVVVIGAGIVGNSLVYHLARLGWRDIVQLDKGPLPNPGGPTGHASNFIFPVDHPREIDRKRVVEGKSVDFGGRRIIKKQTTDLTHSS